LTADRAFQCLVFDIGGVLIHQDLRALAERLAARCGQDARLVLALLAPAVVFDVETGRVSAEAHFARTIAPRLPGLDYEAWIGAWMDTYELNPVAWGLLDEARRRIGTVCILSNLSPFNRAAIERKFPRFFDAVDRSFLSYETGLHKPDPEVYRTVARALGRAPGACLFLDDVLENVEGARAAGMVSLRYDDAAVDAIRRACGWSSRG
jgi:putative hydrolase of the HAD superfamily